MLQIAPYVTKGTIPVLFLYSRTTFFKQIVLNSHTYLKVNILININVIILKYF